MYEYKAVVKRVVDGDTVDLDIDLGMNVHVLERVRIKGIDAPETYGVSKESEEYAKGLAAKERLEDLIMYEKLIVKTYKDKKGKYGRYIVDLILEKNDKSVGAVLIEEGHAVVY